MERSKATKKEQDKENYSPCQSQIKLIPLPEQGFQSRLFKNFLRVGMYRYSSQVIIFLSSMITSRLLTPSEYGTVALITVFSSFIVSFLDSGFRFATIRHQFDRTYHIALQILVITFGAILGMLMACIGYPIAVFYGNPELILPCILFGAIIFSSSFRIVPGAILDKEMQFKSNARINLITTVTSLVFVIILALLNCSFWSLIIPQLLAPWMAYLLLRRKVKLPLSYPGRREIVKAFHKTKSLAGNVGMFTFFNYWQRNADNLLIGKMYGEGALGLYSRAYALLEMPVHLISGVLQQILFPSFQKQMDEGREIKKDHISLIKILNLVIFPVPLILLWFPHELSTALWGAKWTHVGDFLPVFAAMIILQTPFFAVGPMMILYKKDKFFAIIGSINASVLILAIIVGSQFSLMDIIYFYAFAYVCFCVPHTSYWGHMKSFGFTFKEVIKTIGFEWIVSLALIMTIVFSLKNTLITITCFYGTIKALQGIRAIIKIRLIKKDSERE